MAYIQDYRTAYSISDDVDDYDLSWKIYNEKPEYAAAGVDFNTFASNIGVDAEKARISRLPDRGLVNELFSAVPRILRTSTGMGLRALRTTLPESIEPDILSRAIVDVEEELQDPTYKYRKGQLAERPGLAKKIIGGFETFGESVIPMAVGAGAGFAVGGPIGATLGAGAAGMGVFGLAEYDQFIEEAHGLLDDKYTQKYKSLGHSDEDSKRFAVKEVDELAHPKAVRSGGFEGIFEGASNMLDMVTFRLGGKVVKALGVKNKLMKPLVRYLATVAGVGASEMPSEFATGYLQALERKEVYEQAGKKAPDPMEWGIEGAKAAGYAAPWFGLFGGVGNIRRPKGTPADIAKDGNLTPESIDDATEKALKDQDVSEDIIDDLVGDVVIDPLIPAPTGPVLDDVLQGQQEDLVTGTQGPTRPTQVTQSVDPEAEIIANEPIPSEIPTQRTTEEVSVGVGEKVAVAALRLPNGDVVKGEIHGDAFNQLTVEEQALPIEEGFVTDAGQFITSEEASQIYGSQESNEVMGRSPTIKVSPESQKAATHPVIKELTAVDALKQKGLEVSERIATEQQRVLQDIEDKVAAQQPEILPEPDPVTTVPEVGAEDTGEKQFSLAKPETWDFTDIPDKRIFKQLIKSNPILKNAKVQVSPDGRSYKIKLKNKKSFVIYRTDKIQESEEGMKHHREVLEKEYSGEELEKRLEKLKNYIPVGITRTTPEGVKVGLTKFATDKTLTHEIEHVLEELGIISSVDILAMNKALTAKKKASTTENRADFLSDAIHNPKVHTKFIKKIAQKVMDFIDAVMNMMGVRTAQGVVRDVKSGKIFKDKPKGKYAFVDGKVKFQVDAFHGGPHAFDEFSAGFEGTGAGGAAFGYGTYVTELKSIAKGYAKGDVGTGAELKDVATRILDAAKGNVEKALKIAKNRREGATIKGSKEKFDEIERIIRSGETPRRNLYRVTLHKGKKPGEYTWLDWDKVVPQDKLDKINNQIKKEFGDTIDFPIFKKGLDGEVVYRNLGDGVLESKYGPMRDWAKKGLEFSTEDAKKQASLFLLRAGIDGIRYPTGSLSGVKDTGKKNYVVFDESAVTIEEHVKFSIATVEDTGPQAYRTKYFGEAKPSIRSRISATLDTMKTQEFWDKQITKWLDKLHPVKRKLGMETYRLKRGATGVMATLAMLLEHGGISMDKHGVLTATGRNEGFMRFLESIPDHSGFLYWDAAKRADELKKAGKLDKKDILYDDAARKEIFDDNGGVDNAEYIKLNKTLQKFNKEVLNISQTAGLISAAERKFWEQEYYVPFHRIFENKETAEEYLNTPKDNRKNISADIHKLIGSQKKMGDPLTNILRNWAHLIDQSMQNVGQSAAVRSGVVNKEIIKVTRAFKKIKKKGEPDRTVPLDFYFYIDPETNKRTPLPRSDFEKLLSYKENGKTVYFLTRDDALFQSLAGINPQLFNNVVMKFAGMAKRALTYSATFGPAFKVANTIRDSLHTALINKSFIPIIDTAKGFMKAMSESPEYIAFMASGFGFGSSYIRAEDPTAAAKFVDRILKKEGQSAVDRILKTPRQALAFWEKIGAASENAARVQLYSKLMKDKGFTHGEAAFEARDLLDFTMSGQGNLIQIMIQNIPFLNARIQGIYKLGRSVNKDNWKNMATRASMLAGASIALWWLNKDDDRWKELEDWDKWGYTHWWVGDQHYRMPNPFEVGAFAMALPVSVMDIMYGNEDTSHFADFIGHTFTETFAIGYPQLIKTPLELWANKSTFTGRPIIGTALKGLKPGQQADPWTSETLKLLGEKMNISPKKAEAIVKGYFSTIGTLILGISDIIAQTTFDLPERPDRRIDDYPLLGRFMRRAAPARHTKQLGELYEMFRDIDEIVKTASHYRRTGDMELARKLVRDNATILRFKIQMGSVRKQLTSINNQMKAVWRNKTMSGDAKDKRIDLLLTQRNRLVDRIYNRMK